MLGALVVGSVLLAASPAGPITPPPGDLAAYEEARAHVGRDPDAHVRLALWCEAHGLQAERLKHLAIAVLTDPKHATARGLMGLVAYGGQWRRPEAVAETIRRDAELAAALAEYNARREAMPRTADAHWQLALWCEEKGLDAEATAHLTAVTRLDPSRDAAWKRLGCKKHNGRWMTDAQIAEARAEDDRQKKADRHWRPLLEKWRDGLWDKDPAKRSMAEEQLDAVTDPGAVPAIRAVFAVGDPARQLVAARVLGQIDSGAASRVVAGLAVFGKSAEVRRVATETLRRRDPRDFVGLLIGLVRRPIKYEVRPVNGPGSQGVLFVEGKQFNVRRIYATPGVTAAQLLAPNNRRAAAAIFVGDLEAWSEYAGGPTGLADQLGPPGQAAARRALLVARAENLSRQATAAAEARLASDVNAIETTNAEIRRTNALTLPVLNDVTGHDDGEDDESWKAWWADQQGYKYDLTEPRAKPTFTEIVTVPTPSGRPHNACFGAGTPVHTLDGPRPIETIRVGDRVLSQDTTTGALGFEPVVAALHNKPAPTLRVGLDGEVILATGIHRFWKAGKGWTMARDLKPGDVVRTVGGVARVASVEDESVQPVYNLELARGRSFFVGRRGALVHDNSLVEPTPEPFDAAPATTALVPAAR